MGYPPPPPSGPQPGQGGGFGPPQQGYGYPQQGAPGGYGYPQQGAPGGYGYPQQGGPPGYGPGGGPPGPPPGGPYPPRGGGEGGGAKVAAIVIAAIAVVAVVIGGAVVLSGADDESGDVALPSDRPSVTAPSATEPEDEPSPTETPGIIPYIVLTPGKCFDHPSLDSSVSVVTVRGCGTEHDAEVISNATLSGTFTTMAELSEKALKLCEPSASEKFAEYENASEYLYYALYPDLTTYENQGKKTVTCALTMSTGTVDSGKKMDKPLP